MHDNVGMGMNQKYVFHAGLWGYTNHKALPIAWSKWGTKVGWRGI